MNYEIFIFHKNTMRVFVYGLRDSLFKFSSNIFDRSSGQNCSQPIRLDSSIGSFGSLLTPSSFFFFPLFFTQFLSIYNSLFIFFYCLKSIQ